MMLYPRKPKGKPSEFPPRPRGGRAMRLGTVIVFKKGVTKAQALAALSALNDVVEPGRWIDYPEKNGRPNYSTPIPVTYRIEEFDEDTGGPVWYVP